jgi:hypothetical protein
MSRYQRWLFALPAALVLLLVWSSVRADAPSLGHPAQIQIQQSVLPNLAASEAEHAAGAYIPGVGAVMTMDLLRGPNSKRSKPSYEGTRDWVVYLMQTFGPKLTAVPPNETIAMSVDFYDYGDVVYHQLVITSRAADVADPQKYLIWLDGKPYDVAVGQLAGSTPVPPGRQPLPDTGPPLVEAVTPVPDALTATPFIVVGPLDLAIDFGAPPRRPTGHRSAGSGPSPTARMPRARSASTTW